MSKSMFSFKLVKLKMKGVQNITPHLTCLTNLSWFDLNFFLKAMENCKTQSDQQVNEDAKKWSCDRCGTMKTPSKRKGPDGPKVIFSIMLIL